jgi:hypothetical protein
MTLEGKVGLFLQAFFPRLIDSFAIKKSKIVKTI